MGLDWHLTPPPLPGKEPAIARLDAQLAELWQRHNEAYDNDDDETRDKVMADIEPLLMHRSSLFENMDCAAVAGAPRVGVDPEALVFLRANEALFRPQHRKDDLPWDEHVEQLAANLHGRYLIEASRDREALPIYSAGPVSNNRYDFRGQVMLELEPILGKKLLDEAGEPHDAGQCLDYAARIEQAISPHLDDDKVANLVVAAQGVAVWLRYWGERRMGFAPSY
jgi:hypothetical protein